MNRLPWDPVSLQSRGPDTSNSNVAQTSWLLWCSHIKNLTADFVQHFFNKNCNYYDFQCVHGVNCINELQVGDRQWDLNFGVNDAKRHVESDHQEVELPEGH